MKSLLTMSFATATVLLFLGCSDSSSGGSKKNPPPNTGLPSKPVTPDDLHFANVTNEVFSPKCYKCHNRSQGHLEDGLGLDTHSEVKANSAKIYRMAIIEKKMPKDDTLTTRQYNLLKAYLEAGSPEWDELEYLDDEF